MTRVSRLAGPATQKARPGLFQALSLPFPKTSRGNTELARNVPMKLSGFSFPAQWSLRIRTRPKPHWRSSKKD